MMKSYRDLTVKSNYIVLIGYSNKISTKKYYDFGNIKKIFSLLISSQSSPF